MEYTDEKTEEMTDLEKAEQFYRQDTAPAHNAIREFIKDSPMIVHGGRAINAQLPDWLDRETKDWDIFTKSDAESRALELEGKLDKRYGGDFFSVEPAVHPDTFRVRMKVTGDVIADITLKEKRVAFRNIEGINYATLGYHERRIRQTLVDPEKAFRHRKDSETLQRIKIFKRVSRKAGGRRRIVSGVPGVGITVVATG